MKSNLNSMSNKISTSKYIFFYYCNIMDCKINYEIKYYCNFILIEYFL